MRTHTPSQAHTHTWSFINETGTGDEWRLHEELLQTKHAQNFRERDPEILELLYPRKPLSPSLDRKPGLKLNFNKLQKQSD